MIEQPAGRRDDDVGAAFERGGLLAETDAAVHRGNFDVGVFGEGGEVGGDLHREFARRCETQRAGGAARQDHQHLHERHPEGGRLAAAGGSAAENASRPASAGGIAAL